ncbi:hypothetical protein [Reinekea sp. G2M2-21]|uniref:hypothetical protein n=1 Tax=Reinekea sp. G2M2-21 TaxID=2788942 RepID=UPI0018A92CC8|nr:hypothetical protein [Reinekea sp. G2M2-21]
MKIYAGSTEEKKQNTASTVDNKNTSSSQQAHNIVDNRPAVKEQRTLQLMMQMNGGKKKGLNPNAADFVPQAQQPQPQAQAQQPLVAPYPNIANNAPVNALALNQIINLPPIVNGHYAIVGQWHHGFEGWALHHGFNDGMVAHFNVQANNGPMLHVYYNAFGQLEVVGIGQRPQGY